MKTKTLLAALLVGAAGYQTANAVSLLKTFHLGTGPTGSQLTWRVEYWGLGADPYIGPLSPDRLNVVLFETTELEYPTLIGSMLTFTSADPEFAPFAAQMTNGQNEYVGFTDENASGGFAIETSGFNFPVLSDLQGNSIDSFQLEFLSSGAQLRVYGESVPEAGSSLAMLSFASIAIFAGRSLRRR